MLLEIKSLSGQTMYDLCLMSYGTLDLLLKFCTDNSVDNVNYIPGTGQTFIYDSELVVNQQIAGIVMATLAKEEVVPIPPFVPPDIEGIMLWVNGSAGVTTTGSLVDSWADQSGNGHLFTATGSFRPTYDVANSKLVFSAASFNSMISDVLPFSTTKDITIFIVLNDKSTFVRQIFLESSVMYDLNNGFIIILNDGTDNTVLCANKGNSGYDILTIPDNKNQIGYITSEFVRSIINGTDIYWNGSNSGATYSHSNNTNSFNNNVLYLGSRANSSDFFTGDVHEIIIYSKQLTPSERGLIDIYIQNKYSI